MYGQLDEYGQYSTRFSFAPGKGLPGRVFCSGEHSWEQRIDQADPSLFERAGGASVYGVKTCLGLCVPTKVIGRIVVALYSVDDLEEDERIVRLCEQELQPFSAEPKWSLLDDLKPEVALSDLPPVVSSTELAEQQGNLVMDHYQHSRQLGSEKSVWSQLSGPPVPASGTLERSLSANGDNVDEEQQIANMLGNHMPLQQLPDSGAAPEQDSIVLSFMSLRLLLLRSPSRRSEEDNDALEVIKKSYRGYARDGRRSEREIAFLLVNDWQFLMMQAKKPRALSEGEYVSHEMEPSVDTYGMGAPTRVPSLPNARDVSMGDDGKPDIIHEVHE
jgi:hypothetical protein